jgi:preprotein translocase SecE subunit
MAEEPVKRPKRKLRNPESFREKALKASAEKPENRIFKRIKMVSAYPFKLAGRGIKAFFGLKLFKPFRKPARIVGKILFPSYFRKSFEELKLVTWPTFTQSRQLTFAVLVFAVVFGLSIAGLDWGLDKVFRNLLLK